MRPLQRIFKTPRRSDAADFLRGRRDLPSVDEFINFHLNEWESGGDVKKSITSDVHTVAVARKVFESGYAGRDLEFFEKVIFGQSEYLTKEANSLEVKISDIRDFPECEKEYESRKNSNAMICVGGPAAEDQVVIAGIIDKIHGSFEGISYLTRDYRESNVNHSAKQSHSRHASALNADEILTGHALLPTLLKRKIIGDTLEDVLDADYRKVDVRFNRGLRDIMIYAGNELNWLKQEYRRLGGKLTEHDINRMEAVISQEVMRVIEEQAGLKISDGVKEALIDSSSIHVTFGDKNSEEVQHENAMFERAGIRPQELTKEEIKFFFQGNEIFQAWKYPGDTQVKFNDHITNQKYAESRGINWIEGVQIDRVLLAKGENNRSKIAGLMTKDGKYFYANKLHFTGGYKVEYVFDKNSKARFSDRFSLRNVINKIEDFCDLQKPLPSDITTATGVSINAVFRRSEHLNNIIKKYGSIGQIAVTNSHWTVIAYDDEYLVVRMTGGGNTGSEKYSPSYFLNILANTRRIFGDDLVGIISTYGCPRAVNARNSTEFVKIADGGVISYGKGGAGNTKRHAEAVVALMESGFESEIIEYFNQFYNRENKLLGAAISEVCDHLKDVKFLHDSVVKTSRRMGYDQSLSINEKIVLGIVVMTIFWCFV